MMKFSVSVSDRKGRETWSYDERDDLSVSVYQNGRQLIVTVRDKAGNVTALTARGSIKLIPNA